MRKIKLPLTKNIIKNLRAGEEVLLSGKAYTARDRAHKRLYETIKKGRKLPIDLKGAAIYYCGPNPPKPKKVIGSCGPTTSGRMDDFTPLLLRKGLTAMIGKGRRSRDAIKAIKKYRGVYFVAVGGAGAYLAGRIKKVRTIAYKELGTEAIRELIIEDFPVTVAIDPRGKSIFS